MDGFEILNKFRVDYEFLLVIMISGYGNIEIVVFVMKMGVYDFIEKFFKVDNFILIVECVIEVLRLCWENFELKSFLGGG